MGAGDATDWSSRHKKEMGIQSKEWSYRKDREAQSENVTKGYAQRQEVDFEKVFTPVARMETMRLLLILATYNKWQSAPHGCEDVVPIRRLTEEVYV